MMWLDIVFMFIFLGLEALYYKKFRDFEKEVFDQLLEVNRRLEIAIERIDNVKGEDK